MEKFWPFPIRRVHRHLGVQLAVEALEHRQLLTCNVINGFVYQDLNNNGLRDGGEPAIANVPLELRDNTGRVVASTTTDGSGFYEFDRDATIDTSERLLERSISFSRSVNGAQTKTLPQFDPDLGELTGIEIIIDGSITSQIKVENFNADEPSHLVGRVSGNLSLTGPGFTGLQISPNVIAGEFNATPYDRVIDYGGTSGVDFGSKTASASGTRVISDALSLSRYSGSGTVPFTLNSLVTSSVQGNGDEDSSIRSTATANVRVIYHYIPSDCLQPGNYTIHETQPRGFIDGRESQGTRVLPLSNPNDVIAVVLNGADSINNNFGELKATSLLGCVYVDSNNNGMPDPGEPGIAGVTIVLDSNTDQGAFHLVTTTDQNGRFAFTDLIPGVFTVTEIQPAGFDDGKDMVGTAGGLLRNDQIANFWLQPGQVGEDYCFGELNREIRPFRGQIRPLDFDPAPVPLVSKRQLSGDTAFIQMVAANASFVDGIYRRFLGREADQGGLFHWVSQLAGGRSRLEVVSDIWGSREHRGIQVDELYQQFLQRSAAPEERAIWAERFLAGATQDQISADILASDEYRARFGPSDAAFVDSLYTRVLGRVPDQAGRASWINTVTTRGRRAVALGFLSSAEAFGNFAFDRSREYLKRPPSGVELEVWTSQLVSGRENLDTHSIKVLAMDEVFARAVQAVRENRTA